MTGGCGVVTASGTITINDIPVITVTPDDPNTCNAVDGSILVNGSGTGNVAWSGPVNGSATGVPLNYTISGLGAGTYDVYFVDANGCQSATVQASLVNPGAPVLDIINDITNCGTSYTLPAISGSPTNAPAYYTAPGGPTGGGSVVPVGTTYNAPTTITLYAYDANGSCTDEEPFTITINVIPTVNDPANILVCPGAPINPDDFVSVPAGATYAWTNTNIAVGLPGSSSGQITTYNAPANGTGAVVSGDITVIPTLNGCAGPSQTFTISISPTPTVNDPADVTVCPGSTIDPADFVSVPGGAVFGWTNSNIANGLGASGSGQITPYTAPANGTGSVISGDITVTPTLNGCIGSPQVFVISVSPTPTITLTPTPPSTCNGTNGSILVSGAGSGTVTWSGTASGTNPAANLNYAITGLSAGNYDVFFINGSTGCQSATVPTTLINPGAPVVNPITSVLNCGTSYSLTSISGTNLVNAQYYTAPGGPSGGGSVVAAGTTYTAPTNVTLYAYDANGSCTDEESFTITINPLPTASISGGGVYCAGQPVNNVQATVTGAGSWTVNYTLNGTPQTATGNSSPISLGNAAGTYVLTGVSDANCSNSATGSQTITVNSLPTASISGGNTYCSGSPVSDIQAAVTGAPNWTVTYTLNGGSPQTISGSTSPISLGNAPGVYVITNVNDANCSNTATGTQTITVNPIPTATIAGGAVYCAGQPVNNILATVTGAGNWTVNYTLNGTPQSATGNASPISLGNAAGTYVLTGVSDANCSNTAIGSQTITINALPTASISGGNTYCAGDAVANIQASVTGVANWTVSYSLNGGAQQFAVGGTSPISLGNAPGVYTLLGVSDANCINTASGTQSIVINPLPQVTALTGGATYCAGAPVANIEAAVTGTSDWTISFTLDGVPQTPVTGSSSPIALGNGAGVYAITGISDANCTNTASGSQTIIINALPTVTAINGGADYCPGSAPASITVDVTGAPTFSVIYTINGGAPQTATGGSSPITLGNTPGTYVVTNISDLNCANTATGTQTITINPTPLIALSINEPSVCSATDGSILVSGTGNGTVVWSGTANGSDAAATLNYTIPNLGAGNYDVYFIDGTTGCQSATESGILTDPNAPVIAPLPNVTVCDSYSLPTINGINLSGSEAFYNNSQANGGTVITGPITSTQTVWIYDAQGSCSDEESFNVTIDVTPSLNDPGAQTACDSYALPGITGTNVTPTANYYTNTPSLGGTLLTGAITSSQTVWIYDADGTCADSVSFVVTINETPNLVITNPAEVCEPLTIDLTDAAITAGSTNATTLSYWTDASGTTALTNPSAVSVSGTYYIEADNAGCTDIAPVVATINPIPLAPTAGTNATYCSVWTIVPLTASGTGGIYTWYNEAGAVVGTGPTYTPSNAVGTSTFSVTETVAGCEGPASDVTIVVNICEITIPTAFTPDGDGVNEDWEIVDLDAVYPGNAVTIYNRWGNVLYKHDSTVDGPYDQDRWDGTFNGEALPVGSYYFIIDLGIEGEESKTGTVSILKK